MTTRRLAAPGLGIGLALLIALVGAPLLRAQDPDSVPGMLAELRKKGDDAEVSLLQKLADTRTRAAAEGLAAAYDKVASIFMHREIARQLARFEGVAEAEQFAFEKLANIAGTTEEPEVREAAIKGLGQSKTIGKQLLKQIVDSEGADQLREPALRAHVAMGEAGDATWYRFLWNVKRERRKNADGTVQGPELNAIRELAFQGLVQVLGEDELAEMLRIEPDPKIRRVGLTAMFDRKLPKTAELAQWLVERVDFPGPDRMLAARILVDLKGAKAIPTFLELYKKRDVTPEDLREEMAKLIAQLHDEATDKKLVQLIGKGKPHERVFVLQATAKADDPKSLVAIRKELADKDPDIRRAAARALGSRRDKDAVPLLRALLDKPKVPGDARLAIDALAAIQGNAPAWLDELAKLCASADRDVRTAAVDVLGQTGDSKWLPVLLTAMQHEDWSTRLIAIQALPGLKDKAVMPKLLDALDKEKGRVRRAVADALWTLTAQPFDEDAAKWRAWWTDAEAKFKVASADEVAAAKKAREDRRLRARTVTASKFFGIQVESERVIFVVDCSGSMLESVFARNGQSLGKHGTPRIDVLRQELTQAITNLVDGALFNIFAFSTGVERWKKDGIAVAGAPDRKAAQTWVDRLGASGGTNLFDAVKMAFDDQDVDTIFIMSDGEPTNGEITDPHRIREEVRFWNAHRKIKIHTIAIGGNFEILEWLAADSGGTHVRYR